ncbi:LysR family transcriptional regulator [Liquorilactobacillus nagelii]|uniref:LysR family transcriptional regulator n=1 Tax=Liquorilactobacillus nagelii TaxID=82688 RepID=UPI0039E9F701
MEFHQLECFVVLAETLNFSTTAKTLFISQPAVTAQINKLENEIGCLLFNRNTRNVQLTAAGEKLYASSKNILVDLNNMIMITRHSAQESTLDFTIGYENNLLNNELLPLIIKKFNQKCPRINVILKMTNFREKNNLFESNQVDVLFTIRDFTTTKRKDNFIELYRGKFVCTVSLKSKLKTLSEISASQLKKQTLILLNPITAPPEMNLFERILMKENPQIPIIFSDNQISGLIMTKSNLGVAIMPDFIAGNDPEVAIIPYKSQKYVSFGLLKNTANSSENELISYFEKVSKEVYGEYIKERQFKLMM